MWKGKENWHLKEMGRGEGLHLSVSLLAEEPEEIDESTLTWRYGTQLSPL